MAADKRRPSSLSSRRSRPIILLDRIPLASDDRCFNGWRLFGLPPLLDDDADTSLPGSIALEG